MTARGEIAYDKLGLALIECSRGTNDVENSHKHIVTAFGGWCTGVEMADALLGEFRHRHNHAISERRRLGFPRLGHFDTWLVDTRQLLVERNHNVMLYPEWSNTSDFCATPECFGTVPLHSAQLAAAIADIELPSPLPRLTSDHTYLCNVMGTTLPLLPVHGKAEYQLFARLSLRQPPGPLNFEAMAVEWCTYVDGITIFPKLPVYLRTYRTTWERNGRVRDAITRVARGTTALRALNSATLVAATTGATAATAPTTATDTAMAAAASIAETSTAAVATAAVADDFVTADAADGRTPVAVTAAATAALLFPPVLLPPTMPRALEAMMRSVGVGEFVMVGGVAFGGAPPPLVPPVPRKHGQRGNDSKGVNTRPPRRCIKCISQGRSVKQQHECAGAAPRPSKTNPFFCTEPERQSDQTMAV